MKNITKTGLFIAGFLALILLGVSISAETVTDGTGDVWKQKIGTSGYEWTQTATRDNVDVTSLGYEISGSEVTVTLSVAGEIQETEGFSYYLYLENSSGQYYAYYTYGSGMWIGLDKYNGEMGELTDPISGNTFSATFEIDHPEDDFNIYGFASESVDAMEAYYDYAPNSYAPYYEASSTEDDTSDDTLPVDDGADENQNEQTDDNAEEDETTSEEKNDQTTATDTPGFELFFLIAGLATALIIFKRRS